jgi:hypothetical protein
MTDKEIHFIRFDVALEVTGNREFAEEIRAKIDDAIYDSFDTYCDEPECCPPDTVPEERVSFAISSSRRDVGPIDWDEDDPDFITAKAFEQAADIILGESINLRDAATCRDIAGDLRFRAAALRGDI